MNVHDQDNKTKNLIIQSAKDANEKIDPDHGKKYFLNFIKIFHLLLTIL